MENLKLSKWTHAFGLSLAITSLINACLVVLKESNKETVFAWMKMLTGHHWVSQGIISLVVFVMLAWLFARQKSGTGIALTANTLLITIVGATALSSLIIAGYFIL